MLRSARTVSNEKGQTMAEYTVVLGVITLAIVFSFGTLSGAMEATFERIVELISAAL